MLETVGLWGPLPEEISALRGILPKAQRERYRFTELPAAADLQAVRHLELLAVSPGAELGASAPLPPCRLLLLPGAERQLLRRVDSRCVISYGGSSKDSLTLSSLEGRALTLSVQRVLPRLDGASVERQELRLLLPAGLAAQDALFRVGLLLLLGFAVEDVGRLLDWDGAGILNTPPGA